MSDSAPRHEHLVGLRTFASGCVDAASLMSLGGAFTSVTVAPSVGPVFHTPTRYPQR